MTHTEELVSNFLRLLTNERPLLDDAIPMLTLTNQHEYKHIGGIDVKATINGLYSLVHQSSSFYASERITSNEVMKDIKIILHMNDDAQKATGYKTRELQCRCIKEVEVRKTGIEGEWGINVSSFKFVDVRTF